MSSQTTQLHQENITFRDKLERMALEYPLQRREEGGGRREEGGGRREKGEGGGRREEGGGREREGKTTLILVDMIVE